MEDEHGLVNVIVWRQVADAQWRVFLEAQLLGEGVWQMVDGSCHLVARRLLDLSSLLGGMDVRSRDFQ